MKIIVEILVVLFPACAGMGPLVMTAGFHQSIGVSGTVAALLGGFMISAALYALFALLIRQAKEIESLKESNAQRVGEAS